MKRWELQKNDTKASDRWEALGTTKKMILKILIFGKVSLLKTNRTVMTYRKKCQDKSTPKEI